MEQKQLLFYEWVAYDNCNLKCGYCVNKGEYSHKKKHEIMYNKGAEVNIANRIVELSDIGKKVLVTLTGGEPLLLERIDEVISILASRKNINVKLVTNFRLIDRIQPVIHKLDNILVSLHIKYRTDKEIEKIVEGLNKYKSSVPIIISQVDYKLTEDDRKKLNYIKQKTRMHVRMQTFIPPWVEDTVENREISDDIYVPTKGKYCTLGYFYYLIHPDGSYFPNLWCNDRSDSKKLDFLGDVEDVREVLLRKKMLKCPVSSCGCNYNTFNYDNYLKECIREGKEKSLIMDRVNEIENNKKLKNRLIQKLLYRYYSVTSNRFDPLDKVKHMNIIQSNRKAFLIFLYNMLYQIKKKKVI